MRVLNRSQIIDKTIKKYYPEIVFATNFREHSNIFNIVSALIPKRPLKVIQSA